MQQQPNRPAPRRGAEPKLRRVRLRRRRARVTLISLLILLLAGAIVYVAILFAREQSAPGAEPSADIPDATPAPAAPTPDVVEALMSNKTIYLPAAALSGYGATVQAGDGGCHILRLSDQSSAYFIADFAECVVNGSARTLSSPAILQGGKLYLPLTFYETMLSGISIETYGHGYVIKSDAALTFAPAAPALVDDAKAYLNAMATVPAFAADLAGYESDMNPGAGMEYLTLINVTHPLSADYAPADLTAVPDARYSGEYEARLRAIAARALTAFLKEARANGVTGVSVTSGYRSYAEQESRFNAKVSSLRSQYATLEEAQTAAAKTIQWPGKSEHQSGLACDMHNLSSADISFGDTTQGIWLADNCHHFGFILRYPADKTEITGISYEPWHFRYVGRYHATRMHYLNMTLEEYCAYMGLD